MSQFVLDDQLHVVEICDRIRRWSMVQFLRDVRAGEVIKDERISTVLRELRTATLLTIDARFRGRALRDRRYCILYFALRDDEQGDIPALLRRVTRLPEFRTGAARMGKVARVSRDYVSWWQVGDDQERTVRWGVPARRRGSG